MARARQREKGDTQRSDVLEQLYAVDPEDFVTQRNALARSLRDEGKDREASEIAALRKPPLPAFLANRLARQRPRETGALIAAAEQLSAAHGKGGADELRKAQARHGEALRALVQDVDDVAGRAVSEAVEQRLTATLRAASVDPDAAAQLRRGILADEVEPAGFEVLAGMPVSRGAAKATRQRDQSAASGRGEAAHKARVERLEAELGDARDAFESAVRAFKAAERERDRAERRVSDLEARLERTR
jgi:hypothetical protein